LSKPVRWLRAGYPQGAPRHGYVPLLALMPSRSEAENPPEAGEDLVPRIPGIVQAYGAMRKSEPGS
jgi:hypothetical protein